MFRRLLAALLALAFVAFLIVHREEVARVRDALAAARPTELAIAALLQLVSWALLARLYQRALAAAGVTCGWGASWALWMGALFVNLVAPSAGTAGAALWIDELGRRGSERARVATGVWLAWAGDVSGLWLLALAALARAVSSAGAGAAAWAGTAALGLALVAMIAVLAFAGRRPAATRRLLASARALVNGAARRLGRAPAVPADWPERAAAELAGAARRIVARPARIAELPALALAAHAASAAALGLVTLAFGRPAPPAEMVGIYALTQVVWIVSPVPQGIGVVEGAIAATLVARGTPVASAASIALAYRGLTFWGPMLAGAVLVARSRAWRSRSGR